jgi:phospholipid transport system transporter-binding protein
LGQINKLDKVWKLSGDISMSATHALLAETKIFPKQLKMDFSGVTNVDTATISLIFEWLRQAQNQGSQLTFAKLPENLHSLINLYGVVDLIPDSSR